VEWAKGADIGVAKFPQGITAVSIIPLHIGLTQVGENGID
jgi:hypothetical protein